MKRVVDGLTYNTDTSTAVAKYEWVNDRDQEIFATVWCTRGGAFFIVHSRDAGENWRYEFEPISRDDVAKLLSKGDIEILDEDILAAPPEASAEEAPAATLYVRVPASLKKRVDDAASEDGASVNTWAMRCFERCLASAAGKPSGNVTASLSASEDGKTVNGAVAIPASYTGVDFSIPFAVPVTTKVHWQSSNQALERLGTLLLNLRQPL